MAGIQAVQRRTDMDAQREGEIFFTNFAAVHRVFKVRAY
jgi:hypothetical protein